MPVETFDYYETLELQKNATAKEIKGAYRKLAMMHHPDKDRENPDATARFQHIQIAHETLSNPAARRQYDARGLRPSSNSPNESFFDEDEANNWFNGGFGFYNSYSSFLSSFFGFPFASPFSPPDDDEYDRWYAEQQAASAQHYTTQSDTALEEIRTRKDAEEQKAKAKVAAKQAEESARLNARRVREDSEKILQEKIWKESGHTTNAEKQSSCLHSVFLPKEIQKKKFKCDSCGQKRGMTSYRCPHCSVLICQSCLNTIKIPKSAR